MGRFRVVPQVPQGLPNGIRPLLRRGVVGFVDPAVQSVNPLRADDLIHPHLVRQVQKHRPAIASEEGFLFPLPQRLEHGAVLHAVTVEDIVGLGEIWLVAEVQKDGPLLAFLFLPVSLYIICIILADDHGIVKPFQRGNLNPRHHILIFLRQSSKVHRGEPGRLGFRGGFRDGAFRGRGGRLRFPAWLLRGGGQGNGCDIFHGRLAAGLFALGGLPEEAHIHRRQQGKQSAPQRARWCGTPRVFPSGTIPRIFKHLGKKPRCFHSTGGCHTTVTAVTYIAQPTKPALSAE